MLCASGFANAQQAPLPETTHSNIEYKSVSEALSELRSKPGVEISVQRNWTIVIEPKLQVIWSFAPEGHPAYPSVVKRNFVERDGKAVVDMSVKCNATKNACDALVRDFFKLNEDMNSYIQSQHKQEK